MLSKLIGTIDEIHTDSVVVNVNGLGFQVLMPASSLHELQLNIPATIYTEMVLKQDGVSLYGFLSAAEKTCFLKLINVQGVGGKSALAVLSALSPERVYLAIQNQDKAAFQQAEGIGPKVATRIVNEPLDFVRKQGLVSQDLTASNTDQASTNEIVQTLVNLGYKKFAAQRVINELMREQKDDWKLEEMVAKAIQKLSQNVL